MTNWYAVYTRPRCEKKVAENFSKKKWESYCPLNKETRQWMGTKVVKTPLFQSYVFVRLDETQLPEVKSVDGVINMVCWLGKPAVIREVEMDMMKRFLSVHKRALLEKTDVNINETVRLVKEPVVKKEGERIAYNYDKIKLLLPSIGYYLVAEAEQEHIEVIVPGMIRQQQNLSLQ